MDVDYFIKKFSAIPDELWAMNVDYFIKKFTAIPEELWTTGTLFKQATGQCCVIGHCGQRAGFGNTGESMALRKLFDLLHISPVYVNDAENSDLYPEKTPKARILAVLERIKTL